MTKVEWHPGELYPRIGFVITNLARPAERVAAFYNQRVTCEQYIREGKNAIKWTRLSCRAFAATPCVSSSTFSPVILEPRQRHAHAGYTKRASRDR